MSRCHSETSIDTLDQRHRQYLLASRGVSFIKVLLLRVPLGLVIVSVDPVATETNRGRQVASCLLLIHLEDLFFSSARLLFTSSKNIISSFYFLFNHLGEVTHTL